MALELDRYTVGKIDRKMAKQLVVEYHYSHSWTSCKHSLGLLKDNLVVGVAVYGSPVGRLAAQSISSDVNENEVLELTRLWIADTEGKNIESWFLGQTFEWLKRKDKKIKVLMSYVDPTVGHIGTIYQATNWLYQGSDIRTADYFMYKIGDECYHPRTVFSKYNTNDWKVLQKMIPGIEMISMEKKHRYIYILADKREKRKILETLKHPTKQYAKFERKRSDQLITNKQENKYAKKYVDKFFDFGE